MMLVTILCSVPVSALIQPQVGWKATRFKQSPSLPPQGGCPNFSLFFFFLLSTIFITLTPACLATKDTPGDTKQDLSSMIAQGISGLVRPLLSGLKVSKTHFVYFCKVTEQNCIRSKQVSRRGFSSTCKLQCASGESSSADPVTVHFINRDGERLTTTAKEGESLLEVVVNQNLAIDGFGACEGTLACSTCHLIFEKDVFQKLDAISDEEMDMLDLAYGLTETSRLGCQVRIKKLMDGLTVRVPVEVSDIRSQLEVGKQSKQ
ncbi:adrenodoxin-like protein 2, mitochondrial [Gallus gallus]|uniref:adrenodoxin-like protein 2, mitochondrial n=1 Tax=Gallus gallus TaxID=9031 RepID=UPI0003506877|nr:adrenodoxin-like protein 2, mitochondrial [Gallus gallus]